MLQKFTGFAVRAKKPFVRHFNNKEWVAWPNYAEGDNHDDNWSIYYDHVANVNKSYRNARIPILTERLPKMQKGAIEISQPAFTGKYAVTEAGDSVSHEDFDELFEAQTKHLSYVEESFVEDASMSSHAASRLGVRVISDDPSVALILRTLFIPKPPFVTNNVSRFKGWNLDPRFKKHETTWNGTFYDVNWNPTVPQSAERSIIVYHGTKSDNNTVQFVETKKVIVGAQVIVGGNVPIRGLIDSIGLASSVVVNEEFRNSLALPSLVLAKGSSTTVVINAPDSLLELASTDANLPNLYGVYNNIITPDGVAAMWNGFIGKASSKARELNEERKIPSVVANGITALSLEPNNLAHSPSHFIFYEKGAAKATISEEDAVKRLIALTDEAKRDLIESLVAGKKLSVVGQDSDVAL